VDRVRAFRMLSLVMSAALVVRVVPILEKEESHESDTQASRGRGGLPGL